MRLIGVDVGFSERRRSSGVAAWDGAALTVGRASSTAESRLSLSATVQSADVIAIDAPLLPTDSSAIRNCERAFAAGTFQKKCKPGFSHVPGTGRCLRDAGKETAKQFIGSASDSALQAEVPRVTGRHNIVEAFPNAFLAVCIDDSAFSTLGKVKRGERFDRLYDVWNERDIFQKLTEELGTRDLASVTDECKRTETTTNAPRSCAC